VSDNVPDRVHIRELSLDERAELGHKLFHQWARGKSLRSLAEENKMHPQSVKTLVDEHAAFERANGGDSKMANVAVYKFILEKATEIMENPAGHPALLQAKSYEAAIQAATRLDKLGGHEAPTMHGEIPQETIKDLMQRAQMDGTFNDISPMDQAKVHMDDENEDIVEGEVVDDGDVSGTETAGPY
jgi:hypothetical protein